MKKLVLVISICSGMLCAAQDAFVITNVTLFDGDAVLENTNVSVAQGIITNVGERFSQDATVIDGTGKFLMPALTNSHVHAFMPSALSEAAQAGVLNLFDMHGMEPMQGMLKNQKNTPDLARLYTAGYAATAPGGHGTQYGFPVPTLEKPKDATQWVADRVAAGVDHIKIIIEPWRETISHETAKAIIEEAHKNDKVAVVHISKAADAHKVLLNGADGLVHLWWDEPMSDKMLQEIAAQDEVFVIPTALTTILIQKMFNKTADEIEDTESLVLSEIKRLYDAGVTILAGTDPPNASINMGTDLYKELAYMSEAGIPNLEVLKGATSYPIEKFNIKNSGYIKEGHTADMLLLDKNPVEDISHIATITKIWKAGVPIEKE